MRLPSRFPNHASAGCAELTQRLLLVAEKHAHSSAQDHLITYNDSVNNAHRMRTLAPPRDEHFSASTRPYGFPNPILLHYVIHILICRPCFSSHLGF